MSLVSEALRKARQEARLRDAAARGIPIEIVTRHVGPGRGPGAVVAVLAVVAASLGGAALTWWLLAHRGQAAFQTAAGASAPPQAASPASSRPRDATTLLRSASTQDATGSPGAGANGEGASAAAVHGGPGVASATTTRPGSGSAPLAPASERTGQSPASAHTATRSADDGAAHSPQADARSDGAALPKSPPSSQHQPRGSTGGERSFKIEARLGGVTLHLDYIVHRATSPFAGINGEQVLTGSIIEGFTVEEITPDAVRLAGHGGVVVLRAK